MSNIIPPQDDPWIKQYWRPAIAWQYCLVCLFDFLIFPMVAFIWAHHTGMEYQPWHPITLEQGAFYHLAMLGIIGVSVWGRSQDIVARNKILGENTTKE